MAGCSGIRYKCISLTSRHYYTTHSLNIKNYKASRDEFCPFCPVFLGWKWRNYLRDKEISW